MHMIFINGSFDNNGINRAYGDQFSEQNNLNLSSILVGLRIFKILSFLKNEGYIRTMNIRNSSY